MIKTVEELIKELQKFDPKSQVIMLYDSGWGENDIERIYEHEGKVYLLDR